MAKYNLITELESLGISYEWASDKEVKVTCPFHADHSPSCFINPEKHAFKCQTAGCGAQGTFIQWLAKKKGLSSTEAWTYIRTKYKLSDVKTVSAERVEQFHAQIFKYPNLVQELHNRAVTDPMIRAYRLGVDEKQRITIPIRDSSGFYINIRRYLPGASGAEKMRNTKTRGKNLLWPFEQLVYDNIILTGGEIKAIAAIPWCNDKNFGVLTGLAGEGNWEPQVLEPLRDKNVFIMMDIDEPGQTAAKSAARMLTRIAATVQIAKLPLDPEKHPHGDINDYIMEYRDKTDIVGVARAAQPFTIDHQDKYALDEPAELKTLEEAVTGECSNQRTKLDVIVTAAGEAPYTVPKEVVVACDRDNPFCSICPIYPFKDTDKHTISPENPALIEMCDAPEESKRRAIQRGLGIPRACDSCDFEEQTLYTVHYSHISAQLNVLTRANDRKIVESYCIADSLEANEHYELEGRPVPHPKTQRSTFLASTVKHSKDALSNYEPEDLDALQIFQAADVEDPNSIHSRLCEIYDDLESNVTRIFGRRTLHIAVDLAYHSVLLYELNSRIEPGWVQTLIIGDTGVGKSNTVKYLAEHYNLGETIDCKGATLAGLLGSVQQNGKRWYLKWGAMPFNDKRLVILEELKGAKPEVFSGLTEVRSSGTARITKADNREALARTRIIAVSNPRTDIKVRQFPQGILAVKDLVPAEEDVRRFDFALMQSEQDIDSDRLHQLQTDPPVFEHKYTKELCKALILWAWTREPSHIRFMDGTVNEVHHQLKYMTERYSDTIPLVARGVLIQKLLKMATALACRTFSTIDGVHVLVYKSHVQYVAAYLEEIYNHPACNFGHYSKLYKSAIELRYTDYLRELFVKSPDPYGLREYLERGFVNHNEMRAYMGWTGEQVDVFIAALAQCRAVQFKGKRIVTTPQFNSWLAQQEFNQLNKPRFMDNHSQF